MAPRPEDKPPTYTIVIDPEAEQWRWRVFRDDGLTASGAASTPRLAQGYGVMTAALIAALARSSKRSGPKSSQTLTGTDPGLVIVPTVLGMDSDSPG